MAVWNNEQLRHVNKSGKRIKLLSLIVALALFLGFSWHARYELGGLGPWEAFVAYAKVNMIPDKTEYALREPYKEAVARAIFLKPEEVLTANLKWSVSGQGQRLCEAQDVPINLVRRSDRDWVIGCVPVTSGDVDSCGTILQRPTCRSLGVHQSLWENTTLRRRVMDALSSPCGYIRGEEHLKNLKSEQEAAGSKHNMPVEERTVNKQQYWASCTGEIPRAVEVHLMLLSNTGAAAQLKVISLAR